MYIRTERLARRAAAVLLPAGLLLSAGLFLLAAAPSRADTVASLLGNFTINQFCGIHVGDAAVDVRYAVVFGQLPALRELHAADADGNGVTSQAERDAYAQTLAAMLAGQLRLSVDGASLPLRVVRTRTSLPTEQGGFSLRVDVDFTAGLPAASTSPSRHTHTLEFDNQAYAGRIGWHEVALTTAPGISAFDSNAFATSLTGGLTEALLSLPASGPLDERTVHAGFDHGGVPAGAAALPRRPGDGAVNTPAATATDDGSEAAYIERQTKRLVEAISAPRLEPKVAVLALLGALLLGGIHALSPGHGKTIVGAYLIGSRGTPRHAVFLGATVTITHTLGVFVLGFATLYASRFIVPERLFPILSLLSAVLVLGMGIVLLVQRGRAARFAFERGSPQPPGTRAVGGLAFEPVVAARGAANFVLAPAHRLALADPTLHSHGGGPLHSHLPPGADGAKVTWRSLLTLGISGGLVPCPSAMVLLLAAVALNKTAYGMLLVVAFSVGLAITLTLVGLAFLYARNRFRRQESGARWPVLLPVLSAAAITLVGAALCVGAVRSFSA